jgi:hypothetical protein
MVKGRGPLVVTSDKCRVDPVQHLQLIEHLIDCGFYTFGLLLNLRNEGDPIRIMSLEHLPAGDVEQIRELVLKAQESSEVIR